MEPRGRILHIKIESAVERCVALQLFIEGLSNRIHASPGTRQVLDAARDAVAHLSTYLSKLEDDQDLALLSESELETSIHKRCSLLPILHKILELVERSDDANVRAELLASLRRHVKRHFPKADVILVSKTDLNYTINELSGPLEQIFGDYGLALPPDFPKPLLLATIPAVESDQALLHCILAHEVGHRLYVAKGLEALILPVTIDQDYLKELFQQLRDFSTAGEGEHESAPQHEFPFDEISFREQVTTGVTTTITNWLAELSSDAYGVLTYGPAFLFAFLHFCTGLQRLDASGTTHPPARLRLKLQFMVLNRVYPDTAFSKDVVSFLTDWRQIADAMPDSASGLFELVALRSLDKNVLEKILDSARSSLRIQDTYVPEQYTRAVNELVPLINAHIPPVETLSSEGYRVTSSEDMLNAGWEVFITGCADFRKRLPDDSNLVDVHQKLNHLMMKSLELCDAKQTWLEAKSAS